MAVTLHHIKKEVQSSTARSGGPGGQHVNKVETKVILRWNVRESTLIEETDKEILLSKLGSKLNKSWELIVSADSHRSQLKNKELAFKKMDRILRKAFTKPKPRKATKPTLASKVKRLESKKKNSEKKQWRKKL